MSNKNEVMTEGKSEDYIDFYYQNIREHDTIEDMVSALEAKGRDIAIYTVLHASNMEFLKRLYIDSPLPPIMLAMYELSLLNKPLFNQLIEDGMWGMYMVNRDKFNELEYSDNEYDEDMDARVIGKRNFGDFSKFRDREDGASA